MRTLLALALALPLAGAPSFTIEQALSSPFPSGLTASPAGDTVAWVLNARGVRNVWIARAPEWHGAPLTRFAEDDGQDIDDIAWARDSSAVFFTRGGSVNARGESPNPRSDPAGIRQEIWIAPLNTGAPRKLGDGHSPAPSPDGSLVAWIYGGQIWSASLSANAKAAQLVHARGIAGSLVWAPAGGRLAFTSDRTDHAFIGVYNTSAKTLSFMDPSVDSDQSPAWSPDGSHIAFIRIPADRYAALYGAKRTGQPWSIRVADATTGEGREIWRAQEGMGSVFRPMVASNEIFWTANGRLVFPWERDGWLHLYSIAAQPGAPPALLTPGSFEIEHAALDRAGREVVYSSNQNDIDRRHVWKVKAEGGPPEPLTSGSGLEWEPAPLAAGAVALLHSDARLPARAAILDATTVRDLAPSTMPPDFPSAAMVEPQPVLYQSPDGMTIHGQLFLPPNAPAARRPAVVFFHGGSRRQMLLGWHSMSYYHQAYGFNQFLASRGYIVLSVNYRSGIGYGEEFRQALHFGPTGASEFNDVKGAALYLRSRPDVDPARIGVWGGSYGGYLTALALARASDMFAAGVDLHGVHDWNLELSNPIPAYEPEKRLDVARLAFESSPMSSIATWRSPVLLIQGDDDRNVVFSQTVQLKEALSKQGVHTEQLIFPDEIHDFLLYTHWIQAYKAASAFLDKFLEPAPR